MRWIFLIYLILPAALWLWGSTQSLTEMSTRNLPGGKGRPERRADKFIAICEPIAYTKCGNLDVSQPCGPSRPVTGTALLCYLSKLYFLNLNVMSFLKGLAAVCCDVDWAS
jgi:hypothetical protein